MTTRAPWPRNARTRCMPSPRAAPVTRTTCLLMGREETVFVMTHLCSNSAKACPTGAGAAQQKKIGRASCRERVERAERAGGPKASAGVQERTERAHAQIEAD